MSLRRLIIPLALAFSLLFAASAHAYVYWGNPQAGTIGRANLDGTDVENSFIQTGGSPSALAVSSSHVYWANESGGTIGRANIDGTGVEPSFITGIQEPRGVTVTPSFIYWTSSGGSEIGRANLDGTGKNQAFVTGVNSPCGVAADGGHIYWGGGTSPAFVGRATLAGNSPEPEWVHLGTYVPCGIAVNSANVFVADFAFLGFAHEIGRVGINGGAFQPSLIGEADGPCGLTISGSKLYWANAGSDTIGVANTDGTSPNEELVQTGGHEICGVAVDSLSSPVIPPPPTEVGSGGSSSPPPTPTPTPAPGPPTPGTIRLLKLKANSARGTAQLKVEVDEAGAVTLAGKGIVTAKATAAAAGPVTLSVRPTKAGTRTLKQTERLATKLTVTFVPGNGGATAVLSKSSTLRKR